MPSFGLSRKYTDYLYLSTDANYGRFFLGPTVNDALANVGKTSVSELADRYGEIGFQWKHEYEADFAGIR